MKSNKLPNTLLPFLWYFVKKYKISFSLYIIFTVFLLEITMFFLQPYLLKIFFDKIGNNTITIKNGLILLAAITLSDFFLLIRIPINIFKFNSITKSIEDIRDKIFKYSIKQSANFFNTNYSGELVNKIHAITSSLKEATDSVLQIIKNFFLLLVLIFVLFYFNKLLGIFSIIWFILYSWVSYYYLINKVTIQSKLIQEDENKIMGFVTDNFINIQNIKVFSNEKKEKNTLIKLITKKFRKIYLEIKYQQISNLFYFILNFSMSCCIILVAIFQLKNKIITIGSFVFLVDIIRKFLLFSREITWNFRSFKNIAIMQDSIELITNDIEIKDKKEAYKLITKYGKIIFKNIKFNY